MNIPALSAMADPVLTQEEQYKFDVITKVLKKDMKSGLAAKLLGISTRQVRRLKQAIKKTRSKRCRASAERKTKQSSY